MQSQEGSLQQELKSILLASQRNNPPLGVSGALIFNY
ncbi:MAG: blue light sensor protein, partial [Rhizobiales bacterium]|nr:blue light sensor protein [Hyphomicrobiales bacterium]